MSNVVDPPLHPDSPSDGALAWILLDALPCAVIVTNSEGRTTWVNRGFQEICGYEAREVWGKTPGSLLQGPGSDPAIVSRMREALQKGVGFSERILNYDKRGRAYWISLDVAPFTLGGRSGFIGIARDLTEGFRTENSPTPNRVGRPGHLTEAVRALALAANEEQELHQFFLSLADAVASLKRY